MLARTKQLMQQLQVFQKNERQPARSDALLFAAIFTHQSYFFAAQTAKMQRAHGNTDDTTSMASLHAREATSASLLEQLLGCNAVGPYDTQARASAQNPLHPHFVRHHDGGHNRFYTAIFMGSDPEQHLLPSTPIEREFHAVVTENSSATLYFDVDVPVDSMPSAMEQLEALQQLLRFVQTPFLKLDYRLSITSATRENKLSYHINWPSISGTSLAVFLDTARNTKRAVTSTVHVSDLAKEMAQGIDMAIYMRSHSIRLPMCFDAAGGSTPDRVHRPMFAGTLNEFLAQREFPSAGQEYYAADFIPWPIRHADYTTVDGVCKQLRPAHIPPVGGAWCTRNTHPHGFEWWVGN